ncbi:bifunctional DNA-formamidopyrimidine glycosylase/DNA-(apurinic or apyrimidinic site) lyase [Bacillus sp. FJAT-50079]|uniref:bifunctional DNA-formamidopyrimidine glycosylase/DNA-(apurinic or apyrimidinic site) lyase n=1 Tax=Bacillus sp. FJAT-50079 TaxID=2833577 RepID=UPI001BC8EFC1|nr:bifunctional DNA-formamidopyrimidine glycosylase/DNA-(apurinic or apyrimidinic site) lyase [Bacillus sp. FJAT-50079]MBS4209976.1 bifunctional DNA-formamidopyrimidine glycosylase/DNA-(apurinic or apyrimidinic site) lyase [Bacillus sp. FJAT-50079]
MPELPEMETYKSALQQMLVGHPITNVTINRAKSINEQADDFINHVKSQTIKAIDRRAKYLIFHLQNGSCLLLHLMLGGWMFYGAAADKPNRTVQVQLTFGKHHLYFIGLRLGYLHLLSPDKLHKEFQDIGPEPLAENFTIDAFFETMKHKRGGIKTTLINQSVLAGIGNRYSDEILWQAQLLPLRKMSDLNEAEHVRLYESIRFILQRGIEKGGYMDEPLFKDDHHTGKYDMYVHDREGKACKRCGHPIIKIDIATRKTYYCQACQH